MNTSPSSLVRYHRAGKRFGDLWAVRNLDLDIRPGSIVGLIGPSGCGKTTTVRLATGAYQPDEGEVVVLDSAPHTMRGGERAGVSYLPQEPVLSEDLSIWENLNFLSALNGVRLRRRQWLHELLDLVDLGEHRRKLVREASGGMKRRLALAATLANRAPVLILDEPTAGIDPILRRRFWEHFRVLRDEGRTLIVATQYVGEAVDCDHVVLLAQGGVVASDQPERLRRAAYGGDVIEIETQGFFDPATFDSLRQMPGVSSAETMSSRRVRMVVEDGGVVLPKALAAVERGGHTIVDSEEVVANFDDVFVRLVEANESGDAGPGQRVDGEVAPAPTARETQPPVSDRPDLDLVPDPVRPGERP